MPGFRPILAHFLASLLGGRWRAPYSARDGGREKIGQDSEPLRAAKLGANQQFDVAARYGKRERLRGSSSVIFKEIKNDRILNLYLRA